MLPHLRLAAVCFQISRLKSGFHVQNRIPSTRPLSTVPVTAAASPSLQPVEKSRKRKRSSAEIAAADAAATQLELGMQSPEALQRALELLTPRVREAFELVVFAKLSLEEICEKMRPGKPMNGRTIGNYILKAFDQPHDFDGAAALFRAIGREKLTEFVHDADPFRWRKANGYNAFMTNSKRVASLCQSDTARKKLVRDVRNGTVLESDIEREKHRILWGWTKDEIPTIPRSVAAQLVSTELARRRGLSQEQRLILRKTLARMPALDGKSVYEGLDSKVMALAEVVADLVLKEAVEEAPD